MSWPPQAGRRGMWHGRSGIDRLVIAQEEREAAGKLIRLARTRGVALEDLIERAKDSQKGLADLYDELVVATTTERRQK